LNKNNLPERPEIDNSEINKTPIKSRNAGYLAKPSIIVLSNQYAVAVMPVWLANAQGLANAQDFNKYNIAVLFKLAKS
jgi:hypothetical protein